MKQLALLMVALTTGCGASSERVAQLEGRVAALEAILGGAARGPSLKRDHEVSVVPGEAGWMLSGGGSGVYDVRVDPKTERAGHPTLVLLPTAETRGAYGTFMRVVPAAAYHGKRVRLSAFTRTDGTTQRADFWARVQAPDSPGDGTGLAGQWVKLPAASDWTRREIVLDVAERGLSVQYGVGIAGPGTLWVDAPTIEVVGSDVPTTSR